MSVESRDSFDQLLEQELRSHHAKFSGQSPLPAQARYRARYPQNGLRLSVFAKAAAAVASTKAAVAMIVVAAAVGVTGVEEAAITGSVSPADWAARLVQQVQTCATGLASGSSGAGACLGTFVRHAPAQDLGGNAPGTPATSPGNGQSGSDPGKGVPGGGPQASHPSGGVPGGGAQASHPSGGPPTSHSQGSSPSSKPHEATATPTPGGKKPKTHPVGGPFGSTGLPVT